MLSSAFGPALPGIPIARIGGIGMAWDHGGVDTAALIEEATKKSGMIWLALPELPYPRAAWHAWHDGSAYVVTGGIEQPLPGLADAEQVQVTVRSKDKGGRLVTWTAAVAQVAPESDEWAAVTPALAKERLNAPDGEAQLARWADEAYVIRLTPTGETPELPGGMPADYDGVRPVPSPATTTGAQPRMIGAKRRRADR